MVFHIATPWSRHHAESRRPYPSDDRPRDPRSSGAFDRDSGSRPQYSSQNGRLNGRTNTRGRAQGQYASNRRSPEEYGQFRDKRMLNQGTNQPNKRQYPDSRPLNGRSHSGSDDGQLHREMNERGSDRVQRNVVYEDLDFWPLFSNQCFTSLGMNSKYLAMYCPTCLLTVCATVTARELQMCLHQCFVGLLCRLIVESNPVIRCDYQLRNLQQTWLHQCCVPDMNCKTTPSSVVMQYEDFLYQVWLGTCLWIVNLQHHMHWLKTPLRMM